MTEKSSKWKCLIYQDALDSFLPISQFESKNQYSTSEKRQQFSSSLNAALLTDTLLLNMLIVISWSRCIVVTVLVELLEQSFRFRRTHNDQFCTTSSRKTFETNGQRNSALRSDIQPFIDLMS